MADRKIRSANPRLMFLSDIFLSGHLGWAFVIGGSLLAVAAALLSNGTLERALLSDSSRTLGWGASLFRSLLAAHGAALIVAGIIWMRRPHTKSSEPKDSPVKTSREWWLALAGLCLLALALRLWRLDADLWHDEVLTLLDFVRMPYGEIVTRFPAQNQHMFFSVLSRFSISLFGESPWALRLPSVIFGAGSVWALFLLGRRLLVAREALMACALMTVSYHHVWFSQNARGYMGLLFFTLLATWLWLESLERDRWSWSLGYAAAVALGAWLHLTMAFVAAAHVVLSLTVLIGTAAKPEQTSLGQQGPRINTDATDQRGLSVTIRRIRANPRFLRLIVAWFLCASLTLQLHALALPDFLRSGLHEVSIPSEWTNPLWVIAESLRSLRIGFSGVAVVLCGGAMVGVGWLSLFRRDRRAALALVLPAPLAGGVMLALGHNLWPRFFFFSMGFALLIVIRGAMAAARLAARLLETLARKWRSSWQSRLTAPGSWADGAGVALVCLIIAASAATLPRNYRLPKQDFTGARDYIEQRRQPGAAVVAVGLAGMDYGRYFAPHWSVAETQTELDAIRQAHEAVWLVYTLPIEVRAYRPDIWRIIERDFEVVKVFPGTLGGGEVYVCLKR
ncbi:MAG TPA: glycosyltransferase family 39 protein [Blastocatellia bacterium]|nr:glycosyltransferase family 39 protein [Blastocatellia bacterium]